MILLLCLNVLINNNFADHSKMLSEVFKKPYLNGLSFEKEELIAKSQKQADALIASPTLYRAQCRVNNLDPICAIVFRKQKRDQIKKEHIQKHRKLMIDFKNTHFYWLDNNISKICNFSSDLLHKIINEEKNWHKLIKIAELSLNKDFCSNVDIYFHLGLKLEEKFPEVIYKNTVKALYEANVKRAPSGESNLSAYRLGLIYFSEKQYLKAWNTLNYFKVNDNLDSIFLRVLFWKYMAAKKLENFDNAEPIRQMILQKFPLSVYALILSFPEKPNEKVLLTLGSSRKDFKVNFRLSTLEDSHWNDVVRVVELLLLRNKKNLAQEVLLYYTKDLFDSQIGLDFKLYWGVLLYRSDALVENLSFLTNLIKIEPKFVESKIFLSMLYPEKNYNHSSRKSILDPYFLMSIIRQESGFNVNAVSGAKAYGLMQIQLPTAKKFKKHITVKELFNPISNVEVGSKYIIELMKNHQNKVELALAAYNAGPFRIKDWPMRYSVDNPLLFIDLIPLKETREYVSSIIRNYLIYKWIYEHELPSPELKYEEFLKHSKEDSV
jgi:soluble lytic murein transglycosylase